MQMVQWDALVSRIIIIASVLVAVCAALHLAVGGMNLKDDSVLFRMFDLGYEKNVPTWVSTQIWLLVSVSAFLCSWCDQERKGIRAVWWLIGAVFLFASVDDTAEIHENVGVALREALYYMNVAIAPWKGSPGSPWLGFYVPVLVAVLAAFVLFLRKRLLEVSRRALLKVALLAVFCYLTALSMDYFQGMHELSIVRIASTVGIQKDNLLDWSVFVEELLECAGGILFALVFLRYAVARKVTPSL
jgi:hypothetical protein